MESECQILKTIEEKRKKDNYVRKEFSYHSFYRSFYLPESIDESKIKPVGYGEKKPVNDCVNNVKCSEEQHQLNRRTEFKVLNAGEIINSKVKEQVVVDPCKNCLF